MFGSAMIPIRLCAAPLMTRRCIVFTSEQEYEMDKRTMISLSAVLFAAAGLATIDASAQTWAPQSGQSVQTEDSGTGGAMPGAGDSGRSMQRKSTNPSTCTGPMGYCDIYFGS
jgi:hypothetical protein